MRRNKWIVLALLTLAGIALHAATMRYPSGSAPYACAEIYGDITPEYARIAEVEETGRELVVHYESENGPGAFSCVTRADGSLDDVATLDRKADFLWAHPGIVPRL